MPLYYGGGRLRSRNIRANRATTKLRHHLRDQHRLAQPRGDRRGGVPDMDHERAAADRGAVDPISGWKSALIRVSVHICTKDGIDPRLVAALAAERIFTKCTYGCADVKPFCLVAGLTTHVQRRRF